MPKFLFADHGDHLPEGAEVVVGPQWKAWMDGLGAQGSIAPVRCIEDLHKP